MRKWSIFSNKRKVYLAAVALAHCQSVAAYSQTLLENDSPKITEAIDVDSDVALSSGDKIAQLSISTQALPFLTVAQSLYTDDQLSHSPSLDNGNQGIFVGSITVTGSQNLKTENFNQIVESNVGQELQEEDLRNITQQIADMARQKGFIFASATIPEQALKLGILKIELDEGRIDEVRIIGSDNKILKKLLASLNNKVAVKKDVERKLILANDIPQIIVKKTRFLNENGRNILEVNVIEKDNNLSIAADNYGTERFGPVRTRLSYDYSALFSDGDRGSVNINTNPLDPEELVFINADYSINIGKGGTILGVNASAGKSQPGSITGSGNIVGDSRYVSLYANHPLIRSNDSSLWLNTNVAYLNIEQDVANSLLQIDTQVTYSIGLSANNKVLDGRLRTGTTITKGLGVLGTTRFGNPFSSRFDGDGIFTKASFYLNWTGSVAGNLGLYLGAFGQLANRPLLASQELNIGGAFSVRGFDFAELSGDIGFSALAELHYTITKPTDWIDRLQPYIFADGGYVENLVTGFAGGSLLSSGLGIRADIGKLNLEVEGAFPINRNRFETNDKTPQVNINLGLNL